MVSVSLFLYFRPDATTPDAGDNTGTNFFSQFNPFGTGGQKPKVDTPPVDVSGYTPPPEGEIQVVNLKKVSSQPIAGFVTYQKERLVAPMPILTAVETVPSDVETSPQEGSKIGTGTPKPTPPLTEFATTLRYVARETGNIFQTFADKIEERKFLDITIPKVHEAYFGNHGEVVVMRYLGTDEKTIESFAGSLPKEYLGADIINTKFKGEFQRRNILDMSISPDTTKIFYLFENGNGIVGITLNLKDNKKTQIFDSVFTEWSPWWGTEKTITLSTKPSANVPGFAYRLSPAEGMPSKILGNINGLTTRMSPDGKTILYSDNNLSLYTYDIGNGNSTTLGVGTLPEKCVWGKVSDVVYCSVPTSIPFGAYPDAWYQGEVSFSDQLWKIDLKNGNTTLLIDPSTTPGGEEIDGIKLALDENENYLFFVNKKDSFLWEFGLK